LNHGDEKKKSKKKNAINPYKYEFFVYEQLKKQIDSNAIYSNDSTQYKKFELDLNNKNWNKQKKAILKELEVPRLNRSATEVLAELKAELEYWIVSVNQHIASGENTHIKIKGDKENRTWTLPYQKKNDEYNNPFYDKLPSVTISNVLDLVEERTRFMEAFTHVATHHPKDLSDIKGIKACLIANATSLGIFKMADASDLSYNLLYGIQRDYIRLETLGDANDIIVQKTAELPIFKHYNLIENILHGSADGQKIKTRHDTFSSRYSPKYYGLEKGMAPYSLNLNHLAINCLSRGAHEHESHCLWDIYFNNISGIDPDRISTDTEGTNQVNFVPFYFKDVEFAPCYRKLSKQTKKIVGFHPLNTYDAHNLINPSHRANEKIIKEEWSNIQSIMASLMNRASSQSVIMRKLCSHQQKSKTKEALWELNNILQSIYLLKYIDDPFFRGLVRAALNRGEAYHALRRKVGESNGSCFRGASDLEVALWNECARLICNIIIFYNASILSALMKIKEIESDWEAVGFIRCLSPVASQHFIFTGRYEFNKHTKPIDMDEVINMMEKMLEKYLKNNKK
jgi:TnpA family transposase